MNSVLFHLLILWGIVAALLIGVYLARRAGIKFAMLENAGIFWFIMSAFGVVIGLTTFFASEHYSDMRDTAQREASAIGIVESMTGAFPAREGALIREQLYCYATEVVDHDWSITDGKGSAAVDARVSYIYLLLLAVGKDVPKPENWYSEATSSGLDAGTAREERLLLAEPRIPGVLWALMYVGAALIVVFAFFFHLASRTQLLAMLAAVIVMLTAVVVVLAKLDTPTESPFALQADAMRAERDLIAPDVGAVGQRPAEFCASHPVPNRKPAALK
jgi:hypothetical protein